MNKNKNLSCNYLLILMIVFLFIFSICTIIDNSMFLKNINNDILSSNDIVIYILCGITSEGSTNLLDFIRFSIPYILILFIAGIYITNILNRKYFYIIRYKSYKAWIKKEFYKLIFIIIMFFAIYYFFIIGIVWICFGSFNYFSDLLSILYPYCNYNHSWIELIILQYILSITIEIILVIFQFILSLWIQHDTKVFTFLSLVIIIFSFLGKYDIYNPLMLSKHCLLNNKLNVNPITTIIIGASIIIIINLFIDRIIKYFFRRK